MRKSKAETFASVWDAIADTPNEAANLRVRSELMSKIASILERNDWTQAEAASRCGVTQPRINDLLRGRISRFSLDALVNIASALGQRVHVELDAVRARRGGGSNGPFIGRPVRAVAARRSSPRSKSRGTRTAASKS
jgi:predicted XRE-type DNA-binding protein